MEDYIKFELIVGWSSRYLNTFSNICCCCILHTYQYMLCIVAIFDCTHTYYVVHYKIIKTYHILWLFDCTQVNYSFLRRLDNIAQGNTTADILLKDQLRPPLDEVRVDQVWEFHSWTEHKSFVTVNRTYVAYWQELTFARFFFALWEMEWSWIFIEIFSNKRMMQGPNVRQLYEWKKEKKIWKKHWIKAYTYCYAHTSISHNITCRIDNQ